MITEHIKEDKSKLVLLLNSVNRLSQLSREYDIDPTELISPLTSEAIQQRYNDSISSMTKKELIHFWPLVDKLSKLILNKDKDYSEEYASIDSILNSVMSKIKQSNNSDV